VGEGVTGLQVGDRVAYASAIGAYADERNSPAAGLVKIPEGISYETAAAMMLKGLTAQYLLRRTYVVKPGDTILFHAAAGGVGVIATQWAKRLGATVIGTVGSARQDRDREILRLRSRRRLSRRGLCQARGRTDRRRQVPGGL
jgi:NADPH2:quinone reductase